MRFVEHVVYGVFFQFGKLAFNSVEPGGISRSPNEDHVVLASPAANFNSAMRREVVQNQEDRLTPGILLAHPFQRLEYFLPAFSLGEVTPEDIAMNVKERQKVTHPMRATIGRGQSMGMPPPSPALSEVRAEFQRPKLVETNDARTLRNAPIQSFQPFFFASKRGSLDSFHVLVRCKLTRFCRRIVRNVSRLIEETTLALTKYTASFSNPHRVNGCRSNDGGLNAISAISARISSGNSTGRPDCFRPTNSPRPSLLNRRISSRIYSSCIKVARAMSFACIPCSDNSTTCARRTMTRFLLCRSNDWIFLPSAILKERTYTAIEESFHV